MLEFIGGLFELLLLGLVGALIVHQDFRDAVHGSNGEATIFGLLSVKGVAVVLLCGLFGGGYLPQ